MTDWTAIVGAAGGLLGGGTAVYTALRFGAIERLRTQLRKEIYEHETRFSRLHERRLQVIADLYQKLVEAEVAAQIFVQPVRWTGMETLEESGQRAVEAFNDLIEFFRRQRVFLPESSANEIDNLIKRLRYVIEEFHRYQAQKDGPERESITKWIDLWKDVNDEIPKVLGTIETQFRSLLGDPGEL